MPHTRRHRSCARQTRCAAGRPRRRQHDDDCRRARHSQRICQANRLADADGHRPPRQAHRRAARRRSATSCRCRRSTIWCSAAGTSSRTTATPRRAPPACIEPALLEQVRPELEKIRPWPAVFDQRYVKRLDGPNVKKGKNKKDLAEQVIADIRKFKADNNLDRLVMVWCGSTGDLRDRVARAPDDRELRARARGERSGDPVEHGLRVRGDPRGHSVRERGAEPDGRHPGARRAGGEDQVAAGRQRI